MFVPIDIRRNGALMIAVLAGVIAGSMAAAASPGASARHMVEEVTSRLLEELTSQRESLQDDPQPLSLQDDPQRLYEFVDRLVLPHFDFERMSRRVLGKRWKKSSPEQRTRFVSAFRSLLVRTYATVLNEYRGQTVTYLDPVARKKDNEIVIPMLVELAGNRSVRVAYAMHQDGADWKVFDVSVDGVSLVTNYRSSFRSEIARHGIDGLTTRIETKYPTTH